MDIASLAFSISSASPQGKFPIIIGIEGFGGSGKTTIAQHLSDSLEDSYVIHIDDFIVKEKLLEPAWDTGVFDHERLEKQILLPASLGDQFMYQKLVYEENTLGELITVLGIKYLIIEGISCYIPKLRHYFDFKIWINTPIKVAMERGRARDGTHGSEVDWKKWAAIDVAYQKKYLPRDIADFTITNG